MPPPAADDLYEVLVVKYAEFATTRRDVYLHYDLYGEPDGPIELAYYVWIARNGARTVVIDTGFRPSVGRARGRTPLQDPVEACERVGVRAATVRDVVLTHAHFDHAGCLDAFPDATVHMTAREHEFWRGGLRSRILLGGAVEDADLAALDRARSEGRIAVFADRSRPWPGIELVRVGGHTPGQCIALVETLEGTVLIASDAAHLDEEIDRDMPFWLVADLPEMYEGLRLIRDLRASGRVAHVLTGHDPAVLARLRPLPGGEGLVGVIGGFSGEERLERGAIWPAE
ncbi:N-acyl homoserine lactonase family protein [Microbacterium ulmi]|uniref:N-acyl homoserine lactonase family protein n=1 Tax=Microbacterium ulmi TaxID=179095 RepID=A0A7Y2LYN4_9MICO|nr:N-acyl homoserine lactonase family protein [Microbacterium ulmi]NII69848.1 glyoxylase-like metal-dependent hydrolase (beta-lactamase superfamily II) [Microbacterium ulmi]NNH03185.1 N-acyl homoserine lactonase family protein [Microbacterium ulmi]